MVGLKIDRNLEVTLTYFMSSTDAVIASAPVTSRQHQPKSVPVHLHRQPDMVSLKKYHNLEMTLTYFTEIVMTLVQML